MRALRTSLLFLVFAICFSGSSFGQMGTSGVESEGALAGRFTDRDFLEMMMQSAAAQIEWSRIAAARSTNADTKAFAKTVENSNMALARVLFQHGPDYHAVFEKTVTGKNKAVSDKLLGAPLDKVDVEYLKAIENLGHQTSDTVKTEFGKSGDDFCKQLAMRLIGFYSKQDDDARALQKKVK